ncbi:TetR/AcrR family transcriptional regulator [Gordonia phosphorivorans]|uniref:TetR/AcrR family transcriptional regulator n=1 Tax=Gordonia phosphorivorans TaxID=1056982 RepID=A0ABV6H8Z2_9ACTN
MTGSPIDDKDLTAKARIRNIALARYAQHGEDRVSMRAIAAEAGVTVGLVQHHFGNKEGLREAVEQHIVDYHVRALATVPTDGDPGEVARRRDQAVHRMLDTHPAVVDYLRRVLLDPSEGRGRLLARLTELSRSEVAKLRAAGVASPDRAEAEQTVSLMVQQLGRLFLQPMVDAMWDQLATDDDSGPPPRKPRLRVRAETD